MGYRTLHSGINSLHCGLQGMDGCDTDVIFIATTVSYCGGEVG
jgi:hypothetical protein